MAVDGGNGQVTVAESFAGGRRALCEWTQFVLVGRYSYCTARAQVAGQPGIGLPSHFEEA
jgi:hypothetical protein